MYIVYDFLLIVLDFVIIIIDFESNINKYSVCNYFIFINFLKHAIKKT